MNKGPSVYYHAFHKVAEEWHKKILEKYSQNQTKTLNQHCEGIQEIPIQSIKCRTIKVPGDNIYAVDSDSVGSLLVMDTTNYIYVLKDGKYINENFLYKDASNFMCCTMSPLGGSFAAGEMSNNICYNTHALTAREYFVIEILRDQPINIFLFNDSDGVSCTGDCKIQLWDFSKIDESSQKCYAPVRTFCGGEEGMYSLDYNRENNTELLASYKSKGVKLFDTRQKQFQKSITLNSPAPILKYYPDNKSFISYNDDWSITHTDITSGRAMWKIQATSNTQLCPAMECSSSGRFLFYESEFQGAVNVYDLLTGKVLCSSEATGSNFVHLQRNIKGSMIHGCVKKNFIYGIF